MNVPSDRRYHPEHHWARRNDDGTVTVGVTDFAQQKLGELVYVGLPTVGDVISKDAPTCELESNKTAADVYAPIAGRVVEINEIAVRRPEIVNSEPYGDGWLLRIEPDTTSGWDELLEAQEYQNLLNT